MKIYFQIESLIYQIFRHFLIFQKYQKQNFHLIFSRFLTFEFFSKKQRRKGEGNSISQFTRCQNDSVLTRTNESWKFPSLKKKIKFLKITSFSKNSSNQMKIYFQIESLIYQIFRHFLYSKNIRNIRSYSTLFSRLSIFGF